MLLPNSILLLYHKSSLHYANKIKDFVNGLILTDDQRRSALFKSLSLPGMREMVQSFGLSTDNNIGMRMTSNIARFIQDARTTDSKHQRVPDIPRMAVNTVLTAMMATIQKHLARIPPASVSSHIP